MIKLKPLIENISPVTFKKIEQKLKPVLNTNKGRVTYYDKMGWGDDIYPMVMLFPTGKLDKIVTDIENAASKDGWYIESIGWPGSDAAAILNKTPDSELRATLKDLVVRSKFDKGTTRGEWLVYKKGVKTTHPEADTGMIVINPPNSGRPYWRDINKVSTLYHITKKSYLKSIMSQGLVPKNRTDRTYPPRIYLFDEKSAANQLARRGGNDFGSEDNILLHISPKKVIQTNPEIQFWMDEEVSGGGFYTNSPIPASAIKKVQYYKDPNSSKPKWVDLSSTK